MSVVPAVDSSIVDAIHNYMRRHNDYVKGFMTMKEMQDDEDRMARRTHRQPKELKLLFSLDAKVCVAE